MKTSRVLPAVAVALLLVTLGGRVVHAQGQETSRLAEEYGWRTDYRQALEEAREAQRPLMVVFRCVP
jgi:hypothetical protein